MTPSIEKVISGMAEDMMVIMQDILSANQLGDSNLSKELYTKYVENGSDVMLSLFANHYIYWVDAGRKPTGNPPKDDWDDPIRDITDWCRRKGIPSDNATVHAIINKIHKYGYRGKFFLEDYWMKVENITYNSLDRLFEAIISDLTEWFDK